MRPNLNEVDVLYLEIIEVISECTALSSTIKRRRRQTHDNASDRARTSNLLDLLDLLDLLVFIRLSWTQRLSFWIFWTGIVFIGLYWTVFLDLNAFGEQAPAGARASAKY